MKEEKDLRDFVQEALQGEYEFADRLRRDLKWSKMAQALVGGIALVEIYVTVLASSWWARGLGVGVICWAAYFVLRLIPRFRKRIRDYAAGIEERVAGYVKTLDDLAIMEFESEW